VQRLPTHWCPAPLLARLWHGMCFIIHPPSVVQGERIMMHIHKSNIVALRKHGETFVFFYDDEDAEAAIRTLARFAADPQLDFNWNDAAVLSRDVALSVGLKVSCDS